MFVKDTGREKISGWKAIIARLLADVEATPEDPAARARCLTNLGSLLGSRS